MECRYYKINEEGIKPIYVINISYPNYKSGVSTSDYGSVHLYGEQTKSVFLDDLKKTLEYPKNTGSKISFNRTEYKLMQSETGAVYMFDKYGKFVHIYDKPGLELFAWLLSITMPK